MKYTVICVLSVYLRLSAALLLPTVSINEILHNQPVQSFVQYRFQQQLSNHFLVSLSKNGHFLLYFVINTNKYLVQCFLYLPLLSLSWILVHELETISCMSLARFHGNNFIPFIHWESVSVWVCALAWNYSLRISTELLILCWQKCFKNNFRQFRTEQNVFKNFFKLVSWNKMFLKIASNRSGRIKTF